MVENEYSKVKVNNEMDYCSVTDMDVKAALEKAFMKARVSYFLRWEKPGFFARLFSGSKTDIVFCINSAQRPRRSADHPSHTPRSSGKCCPRQNTSTRSYALIGILIYPME